MSFTQENHMTYLNPVGPYGTGIAEMQRRHPNVKNDDLNWVEAYLDSGINSGVSSRGPESIVGTLSDDWVGDLGRDNSTRAQRIKASMFGQQGMTPDLDGMMMAPAHHKPSNGDPMDKNPQQYGGPNMVSKLSQPSQMLKSAVVSLAHYRDDSDLAERALPELVRLLRDDDLVVVAHAASMLSRLARREASKAVVCGNSDVLEGLVQALLRDQAGTHEEDSSDLNRHAVIVLHGASLYPNGCSILAESGTCISALVRLLGCRIQSVVGYALTAIHNVLLHPSSNVKWNVESAGGVERLSKLLARNDDKLLAVVNDCLQILAFSNAKAKLSILACGGPRELIRILQTTKYEKLLWTCTRLLKVISVCNENKKCLLENDLISAMCLILNRTETSERVSHNCLYVIRNLSDQIVKMENLDVLIRILIDYLTSSDVTLVECSAGTLSNLTCNNKANKLLVVQHSGVEALIRTLIQATKDETIESSICALRHLTSRHKLAHTAQEAIRQCFGLPAIVRLLNPSGNPWSLLKATAGLVRNLALAPSNAVALRENGVISRLISIVKASYKSVSANESSRKRAFNDSLDKALSTNGERTVNHTHLARAELVLEACLGALFTISTDPCNRKAVCDQSNTFFGIVKELLLNDHTPLGLLRTLLSLCGELVKVHTGYNHLIKLQDRISELTNSEDDSIAALSLALVQVFDDPDHSSDSRRMENRSSRR